MAKHVTSQRQVATSAHAPMLLGDCCFDRPGLALCCSLRYVCGKPSGQLSACHFVRALLWLCRAFEAYKTRLALVVSIPKSRPQQQLPQLLQKVVPIGLDISFSKGPHFPQAPATARNPPGLAKALRNGDSSARGATQCLEQVKWPARTF